LNVKHIVVGET